MNRRLLMRWAARLGAGGAATGAAWRLAQAQPSYMVSADQLQQVVAKRFPLRYPVSGLFDLDLKAPRLRLLPEQNRLGAEMLVEATGPALRQGYTGTFDVDFALRYEASDQSIRAHQLRVNTLRLLGLPPGASALMEAYGPTLAEQSLREVVVHRLNPQDLVLPDSMGLEPGAITVTAKGLVIGFVNKPPR